MRLAALILAAFAAAPVAAQPPLPTVDLTLGMHRVQAELADSMGTRMEGLMYRKEMQTNAGMVFVFDEDAPHCMWMKNTLIPLSVAFIDKSGTIVNIADMQPQSEQSHCAAKP